MEEGDTKKYSNVSTWLPSASQVMPLNDSDSVPKLFRRHLSATAKLTLGNPCTAILLQNVQMRSAVSDSPACPRRKVAIPSS